MSLGTRTNNSGKEDHSEITVLAVDDEQDLVEVTAELLMREDDRFTVVTETSGSDGIDRLTTENIDCVVSDYDMPHMNGIEFLRTVREEDSDLPFILFTGKGSEEIASDAISAGVTDYLQKGSGTERYELLANRIDTAVSQYRAEHQLERQNDLFAKAQDIADVGAWEYDIVTDSAHLSDKVMGIHGLSPEETLTPEKSIEYYHPDDRDTVRDAFRRAVEEGEPYDLTVRLVTEDGTQRWVRTRGKPQSENGEVVRVRGTIQDITERKEREQTLRRYQQIVEASGDAIYALDTDGYITLVNQSHAEWSGYAKEELIGSHVSMLMPEEDVQKGRELIAEILSDPDKTRGRFEMRAVRPNGETRIYEDNLAVITDEEGEFAGSVGVIRDITDRKEREQQLKQAQERFQTLYEQLSQPVVEVEYDDLTPIVVDVNPAFEDIFGYDRDQIIGESLDAYIVPEERQAEAREINEHVIGGGQLTSRDVTRETADGPRNFLVENALYDETTGGFAIYTDITERKQQEHQLERKNARLSALFDQFPEPTLAYAYEDGEPYIRQVNKEFTETFGYDAEEAVGEHVDSLVVPPDRQTEAEQIDERVQAGDAVDELLRRQTRDGIREFRFRNIPLSENDTIDGYAIYADVTERKLRERELQRKERIIQEMDDGVVVVQDQTITYTNPQVSEIIGYPAEELIGEPMGTYIAPEDRETVRRRYQERLAGNEPPKTYEISLLTRDGGTVPVEITAARVTYGDEPATVSIVRDITDRKERIRELERQNERLEEFASIVSHDLRNPLNVASSRLELAQDTCTSPHLTDIADAHERMERLIDDLLTLARQGEEVREMESVSVTALAGECWEIVETAEATLKTDAEVTIRADSNRLKQALENLIRNAVEHGSSGVMVRIGELAEEPGFYVADDGPGISEDSHEEVFESGYSTAENGTGFGLAIVREIVEAHDWEITVTDSDEGGARFEITGVDIVN